MIESMCCCRYPVYGDVPLLCAYWRDAVTGQQGYYLVPLVNQEPQMQWAYGSAPESVILAMTQSYADWLDSDDGKSPW